MDKVYVDDWGQCKGGRFGALRAHVEAGLVTGESIAGELISSEIEIRSGRGEDGDDARARQADRRRRLFTLAATHGVALGSTGTHPLSDYREQHIIDPALSEFRWMLEEFRVSLFAQELRAAIPISAPRLEKQWALVRK